MTLVCVLIFYYAIGPVFSNNTCVNLVDGENKQDIQGLNLEIPDGYSLEDLLTVRGKIEDKRSLLALKNRSTTLARVFWGKNKNGTFKVVRGSGARIRSNTVAVALYGTKEEESSILTQIRCNKTVATCSLTSQGNKAVVSFDLSEMPYLLSTETIRTSNGKALRSITFCRAIEPTLKTELKLIDSQTEEKHFQIICRVSGLPVLTATWTRDGKKITENTEKTLEDSQEKQTLTLTHTVHGMRSEDTGIYECRGRSLLVSEEGVSSELHVTMQSLENLEAECYRHNEYEDRNRDGGFQSYTYSRIFKQAKLLWQRLL